MILCCSFEWCYHWGKLYEGYARPLIISYKCTWIYNYLKIRSLIFFKFWAHENKLIFQLIQSRWLCWSWLASLTCMGFGCWLGSSGSAGSLTLFQVSFILSREAWMCSHGYSRGAQESKLQGTNLSQAWASVMAFAWWQLKQVPWLSPESGDRTNHSTHEGRALHSHKHRDREWWKAGAVRDSTVPSSSTSRTETTYCHASFSQADAISILLRAVL